MSALHLQTRLPGRAPPRWLRCAGAHLHLPAQGTEQARHGPASSHPAQHTSPGPLASLLSRLSVLTRRHWPGCGGEQHDCTCSAGLHARQTRHELQLEVQTFEPPQPARMTPVCGRVACPQCHMTAGVLSADAEVSLLRLYSAWHCSIGPAMPDFGSAEAVIPAAAWQPQPAGQAEPAPCKLGQDMLPAW